jgi:hypothetical protein
VKPACCPCRSSLGNRWATATAVRPAQPVSRPPSQRLCLLTAAESFANLVEPPSRVELETYGLRNRCSTTELRWHCRSAGAEETMPSAPCQHFFSSPPSTLSHPQKDCTPDHSAVEIISRSSSLDVATVCPTLNSAATRKSGRQGDIHMTTWTKSMSLVTLALCCGMTIASTNARAEESEETTESVESLVSDSNNDVEVEAASEAAELPVNAVDRDWRRRGFHGCYSYCDEVRERCERRIYRGHRRWDDRHYGNAYRRCERRFDFCVQVCRDTRWRNW